ncbi:MAG: ABC transporter substrate-binding protein, partial [Sphingobium sp.]
MSLPLLRHSRIVAAAGLLALVAACGGKVDHGPVRVDVIGTREQMREPLDNGNSAAGQVMLSATAQGLVAFNASGELIGGLAERWIVEDDGQSYLFRLKQARWRDGTPVRANEVARLLRARLKAHPAIVAGLNPDVRGMTDEVLEIRLPGATPSFLQLLAHPAMAIARPGGGTGPFTLKTRGGLATLTPHAPARAEGDREDDSIRRAMPIFVRVTRPALAFARFDKEQSDLVLGGRFQHLPYVALAVPPKGAVRADPVDGLLGLAIEGRSDFLADSTVREILSMAIDRGQIATRLNLAGWRTATTILPDQLDLGRAPTAADWSTRDLALRQSYARSVVDNWTKLHAA